MQRCDYEQVDKAVFKWFSLQRSQNVLIDGPILKEKALQLAKSVNFPTFKASDGWLGGKKGEKNNIFCKIKCSL